MAQDDYSVANADGASVRADLNNQLNAIATNNSGGAAPTVTFAHMWWFDTTNGELKQRDAANTAWVQVAKKDGNGWTPYRQGVLIGALAALGSVGTAEIDDDAVTYAKMQNVSATSRILGRTTAGAGVVEELVIADAAAYRAKTANRPLTAAVWDAAALVTLSDGASIALNMAGGLNFTVTLGGNRTLANPTNTKVGQSGVIYVVQDGTGSRTLAYGSAYKFAGGTAPVLSTAAGTVDRLTYFVRSSSHVDIDFSADRS